MTGRTVVGAIEFPDGSGSPCVGARVLASLFTGAAGVTVYGSAGDVPVAGVAVLTGNDGAWSLDLEPNSGITPAGTVWRLTATAPGGTVVLDDYITVPDSVGPHVFSDLLVDPPGALPSGPLEAHMTSGLHRPVVVVSDYGYDKSAIDEARAAAQAADAMLVFPAGSYSYTSATGIAMSPGEVWVGDGRRNTTITFASLQSGNYAVALADETRICDLTLVGQSAGSGAVGVFAGAVGSDSSAARWELDRVKVRSFGTGLSLASCAICTIRDLYVTTATTGVSMRAEQTADGTFGPIAVNFFGGEISGCVDGVVVEYAVKASFDAVTIEACSRSGATLTGTLFKGGVSFRSCYFEHNGPDHIVVDGAQVYNLVVTGNTFGRSNSCVRLAPAVVEGLRGSYMARITDNVFYQSGDETGTAISMQNAKAERTVIGSNFFGDTFSPGFGAFDVGTDDEGTGTIYLEESGISP